MHHHLKFFFPLIRPKSDKSFQKDTVYTTLFMVTGQFRYCALCIRSFMLKIHFSAIFMTSKWCAPTTLCGLFRLVGQWSFFFFLSSFLQCPSICCCLCDKGIFIHFRTLRLKSFAEKSTRSKLMATIKYHRSETQQDCSQANMKWQRR